MLVFITGGIKSGKSSFALKLAAEVSFGHDKYFIATAAALDDEMKTRIERHKKDRGPQWTTIEEQRDIDSSVNKPPAGSAVIIDCLTLWVSNMLCGRDDFSELKKELSERSEKIIKNAEERNLLLIVIGNEVGSGIIPDNSLARNYIDMLGYVNNIFAASADEVYMMVAGLPVCIKGKK